MSLAASFSLIKSRCCSFTRLTFLWVKRNLNLAKIISALTCRCRSLFPVLIDSEIAYTAYTRRVTLLCDLKTNHLQFSRWKDMFSVNRMQTSVLSPRAVSCFCRGNHFLTTDCVKEESRCIFFMFDPCIVYSQLADRTLADCRRALISLLFCKCKREETGHGIFVGLLQESFSQSQSRCQYEVQVPHRGRLEYGQTND